VGRDEARLTEPEKEPTICIIEDDAAVARLVARVATQTGHRVLVATSAVEALQLIATEQPRLVIADVNLPDFRGPELIEKLRANGDSCPVLFISGDSSFETIEDSLGIAKALFLAKPFTASELRDAIWSALAQR